MVTLQKSANRKLVTINVNDLLKDGELTTIVDFKHIIPKVDRKSKTNTCKIPKVKEESKTNPHIVSKWRKRVKQAHALSLK